MGRTGIVVHGVDPMLPGLRALVADLTTAIAVVPLRPFGQVVAPVRAASGDVRVVRMVRAPWLAVVPGPVALRIAVRG